ncbi:MAG: hypothetical protein ACOCYU_02535 [Brevefilum sp.]
MERTYWLEWEKFLSKHGLTPIVRELLVEVRSLLVLLSQAMVLGVPFIRSFSWGGEYLALIETLGDRDRLEEFSDFLMEAGG